MRAVSYERFGEADVMHFAELPEPRPGDGDVVVAIEARSVNLIDIRIRKGMMGPLVNKRFPKIPGADFSGTITTIGKNVRDLHVGQRVFGASDPFRGGAFAERIAVPLGQIAPIQEGLSMTDAAALPIAGLATLQSLRDLGGVKSGDRVLIHGATGPVGLFAVQLAKRMGGHVTAVAGAGLDVARMLGADILIDYRSLQTTPERATYDVIVNASGKMPFATGKDLLNSRGRLIEPSPSVPVFIGSKIGNMFRRRKHLVLATQVRRADLIYLAKLVADGEIKVVIKASFPFDEALQGLSLVERGGSIGKIVITR